MDYYLDKNNIITLSARIRNSHKKGDRVQNIKEYINVYNEGNPNDSWKTPSNENESGNSISIDLNHEIKFNPESILVTDISYGNEKYTEDEIITSENLVKKETLPKRETSAVEKEKSFRLSSDYESQISENTGIEAGILVELDEEETDYKASKHNATLNKMVNNEKISNIFTYKQNVYAMYGIWSQELKNIGFSYQIGTRLEYVHVASELKNSSNKIPDNNYFSIYPSIHLQQQMGESDELQLSYNRRIRRPRGRELNPFVDYTDTLNIHIGNPALKPQYTNSVELGHTHYWEKHFLISSVFYKRTTDLIRRVGQKDPNNEKVNIVRRNNIASSFNLGIELIYSNRILPWWNFNISGQAYWAETDGSADGQNLDNQNFNWSFKANHQFRFNGYSMQLTGFYRPSFEVAQAKIYNMWRTDMGIRKTFLNKTLTLGLRVRDVFNSFRFAIDVDRSGYIAYKEWDRASQEIVFSLSYNFGNLKVKKKKEKFENGGGRDTDDMGGY